MCDCDALHNYRFNNEMRRQEALEETMRASYLYRPHLSLDGNQWCALYGHNLQDGVAGFGSSPDEAYRAFDAAWREKVPSAAEEEGHE